MVGVIAQFFQKRSYVRACIISDVENALVQHIVDGAALGQALAEQLGI